MLGIDTRCPDETLERETPKFPPHKDQATLEAEFDAFVKRVKEMIELNRSHGVGPKRSRDSAGATVCPSESTPQR
jgi:hypothetical protein